MTSNGNHQPLSPAVAAELKHLIAVSRDSVLEPAEHNRLEQLLSQSREARAMYIAYMQLDAGLDWKVRGSQSLGGLLRLARDGDSVAAESTVQSHTDKPEPKQKLRRLVYLAAGLAATIAIAFASISWLSTLDPRPLAINDPAIEAHDPAIDPADVRPDVVARVVEISDECRWFVESRRTMEGSIQAGETVRLTKGKLRLEFACGAIVTMRSPAALQVIAPKRARAVLGTLTAHAGPGAEGFTIETPRTKVVDLGTDFGIDVTDHGSTDVVVFNGAVDLHSDGVKGLRSRQRLGAGEGVRVSGEGTASRIVSILDSKFSIADRTASLRLVPVISEVRDNIRRGESWHYYEIVHGGMREDAKAFADRKDHEWNGINASGIPSYLIGGDYVKTFNDDKVNRNVEIRVTIDHPAALYVLHDNRSPVPDWLRDEFVDTGDEIGIDGAGFRRYNVDATVGVGTGVSVDDKLSIWRRDVLTAGTVKLGAIQIGGERHNMYGIVAVPLRVGDADDDFAGTAEQPSQRATSLEQSQDRQFTIDGVIERTDDIDAFSFDWAGGVIHVTCHASDHSTLDPVLNVYDANEMIVGYAAASRSPRQDAAVTMDLPAGVYYATVSGGDEVGEIGYYHLAIAPASANVQPPVTPSPSLVLSASATPDGIKLTWNELAGAVSYRVERSFDGVSYSPVETTEATSIVDESVDPAAVYVYRVQATSQSHVGASAPVTVRALPPVVAHLQTFGLGSTSIALSWRDVMGERGYRIQRSVDDDRFETIATTRPNANGFRDTSVEPGQRYFYRISAVNGSDEGPISASASVLSGVGGLKLAHGDNRVIVTWSPDYPHGLMALERAAGCGVFTPIAMFDNRVTEFVDKSAPAGEKLRYRVVALEENGGLVEKVAQEIDRIQIPDNVEEDYFALCFNGKIRIRKSGNYTFHLNSDDGSRLFVNGIMVIDNDGRHSNERVSGTVSLNKGDHDIEVQYFEFFGYSALRLAWSGPGFKEKVVPAASLSKLKYRYYQGEWSNLPFHKAIGKSQEVSIKIPREESHE